MNGCGSQGLDVMCTGAVHSYLGKYAAGVNDSCSQYADLIAISLSAANGPSRSGDIDSRGHY